MITLMNNEILIDENIKDKDIISEEKKSNNFVKDFFEFLQKYKHNDCAIVKDNNNKRVYKLDKNIINKQYITKCKQMRNSHFFSDDVEAYFHDCLDNDTIEFLYLSSDYGQFGKPGKIINTDNMEDEIIYDNTKANTSLYNILFTLIRADEEFKLYCQYTRDGVSSPKYVIDNLLTKFKENQDLKGIKLTTYLTPIIPKNIISYFFGKGSYNKMYLFKNVKNKQSDEFPRGFGFEKAIDSREVGIVAKGINLFQDVKDKIVNALQIGDVEKAVEYLGYDFTNFDDATIEIVLDGRQKTFNLSKIQNEYISKTLNIKGLENNDGSLNIMILFSEYLLEINDIKNNHLTI